MSNLKFIGHHGDLSLFQADKLPDDVKKIEGKLLHKGEGIHEHTFTETSDVSIAEDTEGNRWFTVGAGGAALVHEEHKREVFAPGTVFKTIIERKRNPYTGAIDKVQD